MTERRHKTKTKIYIGICQKLLARAASAAKSEIDASMEEDTNPAVIGFLEIATWKSIHFFIIRIQIDRMHRQNDVIFELQQLHLKSISIRAYVLNQVLIS